MQRFAADPVLGDWHGLLAEIAAQWARRDELRARLAAHPDARFARGPLADHIRARDRYCCGPGCTRSARSADLDHTHEHSRGGKTVEANIGPGCRRHHRDKDRGWTLTQPEPGSFRWVSPLGRVYLTRGEPIRPDLPDPDPGPGPHPGEESDAQAERRLRRYYRKILGGPGADPLRPPPPRAGPAPDDEPPPF
ncbi:HNH endonuclease signature motif containing protein [Pseudonocardia sichuanensis]